MTILQKASVALDVFQVLGAVAVVFFTYKTQQSVNRYKQAIDKYAEFLKQREKLLDQKDEALKRKEEILNQWR